MAVLGSPGGPVVGNPPANVGDTGSVPALGGSHILQSHWADVPQLLSPHVAAAELTCCDYWSLCTESLCCRSAPREPPGSSPRTTAEGLRSTITRQSPCIPQRMKTQHSQKINICLEKKSGHFFPSWILLRNVIPTLTSSSLTNSSSESLYLTFKWGVDRL